MKISCRSVGIGRPAYRQAGALDIKMMFIVYAIKSKVKNYIYVGMTQNLQERLCRHNSGSERTTKPYLLFNLIYSEEQNNRVDARKREKYLKSGVGKAFLKSLI